MALCGSCWEEADESPGVPTKAADIAEPIRPREVAEARNADPDVCDVCGRGLD